MRLLPFSYAKAADRLDSAPHFRQAPSPCPCISVDMVVRIHYLGFLNDLVGSPLTAQDFNSHSKGNSPKLIKITRVKIYPDQMHPLKVMTKHRVDQVQRDEVQLLDEYLTAIRFQV